MVSTWWLLAAFFVGGWAGVLLVALMQMRGGLPKKLQPSSELHLEFGPTRL